MAWAVDQKLPVQQKMVLLMLADRTNKDTGLCIPSMDTLAKNCGMSKASVKRAIKALSELGFIAIHERFSDNVQLSHQYELLAEQTERESNVMGVGSHSTRGVGADSTVGGSDSTRGVGSHSTPNLYKSFNQEFNQERDTPPATRSAPAPSADLIVRDPAEPTETQRSRKAVEQNARGTRLPADWSLSAELGNWAMTEGLTREQVIREADAFRDYWIAKPGAGGRKSDWDATWRNWIRKRDEYRNRRGGSHAEQGEHITHAERVRRQAIEHLDYLDRIEQMERGDRAAGDGAISPTDHTLPQPF